MKSPILYYLKSAGSFTLNYGTPLKAKEIKISSSSVIDNMNIGQVFAINEVAIDIYHITDTKYYFPSLLLVGSLFHKS